MDYLLVGQSMRLKHDAGIFALAFADDADTPTRYVLLRKSLAPDAQDVRLGLDGVHVEIDDQSRSAYRAIARIDVRADLRGVFGPLACIAGGEFPLKVSDAPPAAP